MRVIVVHDARGNIRSVALPAPGVQDQLEPERGRFASEIEVPGLDLNAQPREQLRQLREALENQRVLRTRGRATLVTARSAKRRKRR